MLSEFRSTNITWDKATSRIYSPVTANESDENGRKLVVQIVNGGQVEDLTGATLHLYWITRDKLHDGLDVFKAVDLKKGEFELSYTTGMLSNKGVLNANLVLIDTVGRVVSERFKITVIEGIDDDAIQSENSFSSLTQALIDVGPRLNSLTAQLAETPKKGQIKSQDLSVASDDDKIQLNNLSDEVQLAMAGTTPISPIIPDKSITFEKIGYLEVKRTNLANPAEFELANTSVNASTGTIITYPGFQASGFVEVDSNEKYTLSRTYNVAFYDSNKIYISGLSGGTWTNPLTTPSNAKFIRVTFGLADTNKMVVKGSTLPPFVPYANYEVEIRSDELKQTVKNVAKEEIDTHEYKDKSVPLRALEEIQVGPENLANPADFTANGFGVIDTGAIVSLVGYFATGYIPVKTGLPYSLSQRNNIAWYDINKVKIAAINGNTNYTNPQVAPDRAAFLRASFKTDHRSQAMVIQSDTLPAFIPFGSKQVSFVIEEWKLAIARALGVIPNRLSDLMWNAIGDSITFGLGATKPYPDWVAERTGITVRNYGISMSTICEMDDSTNVKNGTHPASAYNPMCIRYDDMDNDSDVITVMGGTNDISHGAPLGTMNDRTTKTFFGGLHVLILGLIQKYPDKSIGFMLPPMGAPTDGDTGRTEDFIAAIRRVCKYYGIPVLDTYSGNQLSTRVNARGQLLMPDGTHPSDKGQEKLSYPIEQFLLAI